MTSSRDLGEACAHVLLKGACARAGYSAEHARLVRIGSNAVFRLTAPVVVRISQREADIDQARRIVAIARWLESVEYPAVRTVSVDVRQPVVIDGYPITFWRAVSEAGDEYASAREVADILAKLHRLTLPAHLRLPALAPFRDSSRRIAESVYLSEGDRRFLTEMLVGLRVRYAGLRFTLPQGVIHGDASVGNVLRDHRGNAVLIDLDGFAIGPREWDIALTAVYYDSFGWHAREEYESFTQVYGCDIRNWSGYPTMRAIREFLMVIWILQRANKSECAAGSYSA